MLELSGVQLSRSGKTVLSGVELGVAAGECLSLLGPSGSGKSTLLAAIAGLEPVDAGTIKICGEPVNAPGLHVAPDRRGVGMVFQSGALWPHLPVREHLALPLGRWPADQREDRVRALLAELELDALAARLPYELSGGEARRVALGRALAARPRLLLLDEPLGAVDALARPDLLDLIRRALADGAVAAVHVTHDPREARALGQRVAVVADGRWVQVGTFRELAAAPAAPIVARFVALAAEPGGGTP